MRAALLALPIIAIAAAPLGAQSLRGRSATTVGYAQLRPIRYDSAAGQYQAQPVAYAAPLTQDVELVAWGLGVAGLRAYGLLRWRAALGSELVWPRSDDHFDALYAYLELERPRYRLRLGRQQRVSGLGWYAYDGLTATWRPRPTLRLETYGGRGLARGFLEPASSPALAALDPLQPDQGTILLGTSLWFAPDRVTALTAVYQRELLNDRSGLVSERASFDARVGVGSHLVLSASVDGDLIAEDWGKARAGALVRFAGTSFLELEVFRYRPVLDLTTIWGVFTPEAHRGVAATLRVAPVRGVMRSPSCTVRSYEPVTITTPFLVGVDDDAWQCGVGARWAVGDVALSGSYQLHTGFGGAQSAGDAAVAYAPPSGWRVGLRAAAFQQEETFRVTDGTVYGLGGDVELPLGDRLTVRGDVMRFFHRRMEGQVGLDWSQTRGKVAVEWSFGANPDRTRAQR